MVHEHREIRAPHVELSDPIFQGRSRGNHKVRFLGLASLLQQGKEGNRLDCFSKTHLISKNSIDLLLENKVQPVQTDKLVVTKLALEEFWLLNEFQGLCWLRCRLRRRRLNLEWVGVLEVGCKWVLWCLSLLLHLPLFQNFSDLIGVLFALLHDVHQGLDLRIVVSSNELFFFALFAAAKLALVAVCCSSFLLVWSAFWSLWLYNLHWWPLDWHWRRAVLHHHGFWGVAHLNVLEHPVGVFSWSFNGSKR
mmetsp:Transcript_3746/g.5222  ORF Transcript_3746/g.5222 Transcript_3746/m.5222 type:complete len:250 (-) Transcript_3746:85-834(-)